MRIEQMLDIGKIAISGVAAVITWLIGPLDAVIYVLVAAVALDYVSGVLRAAHEKKLSSQIGFWGLLRKVGIFAIVAAAALADRIIPAANGALRVAVCMFYIANELLSLMENWAGMGLKMPEILREKLLQLRDEKQAVVADEEEDE